MSGAVFKQLYVWFCISGCGEGISREDFRRRTVIIWSGYLQRCSIREMLDKGDGREEKWSKGKLCKITRNNVLLIQIGMDLLPLYTP